MRRSVLSYLLFGVFLLCALGAALVLPRLLLEGEQRAVMDDVTVIPAQTLPKTYTLGEDFLYTALELLYLGEREDASVLRTDYLALTFEELDNRSRLTREIGLLRKEGFVLNEDTAYPAQPLEYAACFAENEEIRADFNKYALRAEQGYIDITVDAMNGIILAILQGYAPSPAQQENAQGLAEAFAKYLGLQPPTLLSEREESYYSVKEYLCAKEELVISVRMGQYQLDVSAYPYRHYPASWAQGTYSATDGTTSHMTAEPAGEGKLPNMRREGFVCPEFAFYAENGKPFSPPDLMFLADSGGRTSISAQKLAEDSMRLLYDMFGYLPDSCAVSVTPYGFYFSHAPAAVNTKLPEDSDMFFDTDFDADTGEICGFMLTYEYGFPPKDRELAKPEAIGSMTYEEIARYYYENSSYGDRSPIARTALTVWANDDKVVRLFLADGRSYEAYFDKGRRVPHRMWGTYEKGYFD